MTSTSGSETKQKPLGASKKPMLGMMMIPKTICYIWMIALFL